MRELVSRLRPSQAIFDGLTTYSRVTLGKLLIFSALQFSYLQNGNDNDTNKTSLTGLLWGVK